VIVDGQVIVGFNGNVGEVVHMVGDSKDIRRGCGGTDHWEAYCRGNNMPHIADELFDFDFESSKEIFERYEESDREAKVVMKKVKELNEVGFANIINLFNPEVLWLGGAVALNHYETVVEDIVDDVEDQIVNEMPEFDTCSLGDEAVIHGLRAVCNGKFKPAQ
jgi:glucokinase